MSDLELILSSRRFRLAWMIPAGAAAAAILGLAAARYGAPALILAAGPLAALLMFLFPELGVYAITVTLPIEDLIPGIGPATGTRLIGMAAFGVWVFRKLLRREDWRPLFRSPVVWAALAFLFWALLSTLWAENKEAAVTGLVSMAQLLMLGIMVVDLLRRYDQVEWAARLLVPGGLIAAGFTIQQYFIAGIVRAGDNIAGGINFTASFLVTIMPFAVYLLRARISALWTLLGLLYIPAGIIAITVTFSRTSYLMLALVLVVNLVLLLRTRSGAGWVLLLGGLTAAGLFASPQEAVSSRVQTITPLISSWFQPSSGDALHADARVFHWRVGMEMFKDSPLLGVGYSNFGQRFLEYQFEVQGMTDIFMKPRSPHSSYVGITADLGLVGIGLYLFLLGAVVRALAQSIRALAGAARRVEGGRIAARLYLAEAVAFAFGLQILYGWAMNTHMNKNFWWLLGLSVVLNRLSKKAGFANAGGNDVR